jgi:hypothetical protein
MTEKRDTREELREYERRVNDLRQLSRIYEHQAEVLRRKLERDQDREEVKRERD